MSYGEVGLPTVGRFPNGSCEGKSVHYKKGLSPFQWDGVPLVFLDEGSRTAAVLSPISGFFDSVCSYIEGAVSPRGAGASSQYLRCGVPGTYPRAPANLTTTTALYAAGKGRGVTPAFLGFGAALRKLYGKPTVSPNASVQVERLGYTTVGHFFYGIKKNATMETTLIEVNEAAKKANLPPFGYFLIDSFWYAESYVPKPEGGYANGYKGTWRWDPAIAKENNMFPSGLKSLRNALGAPFVMHMGMWVGSGKKASPGGPPPYALNASWNWTVEENASIPTPGTAGANRFWDWLFSTMAASGLDTYKQDHQEQLPQTNYLLQTPGAQEIWLREMATNAAKHKVNKQYGGLCNGLPALGATAKRLGARVSNDYIPS